MLAGPELTVDGEVKHGELSDALPELKTNADGPDILEAQRRLLTDELAEKGLSDARWRR